MGLETTEGTEPSRVEWSGEVLRKEEEFLATWSWQSDYLCVCVCVVYSAVAVVVVIWVATQLAHPASRIQNPAYSIRTLPATGGAKKIPKLTWTYLRITGMLAIVWEKIESLKMHLANAKVSNIMKILSNTIDKLKRCTKSKEK